MYVLLVLEYFFLLICESLSRRCWYKYAIWIHVIFCVCVLFSLECDHFGIHLVIVTRFICGYPRPLAILLGINSKIAGEHWCICFSFVCVYLSQLSWIALFGIVVVARACSRVLEWVWSNFTSRAAWHIFPYYISYVWITHMTHCIVSTLVCWHFSDRIKQARKMRTSPRRYHKRMPQVQSLWLSPGNIWYGLMTSHPRECIILCNKCVCCFAFPETGGTKRGKMASEVWELNTLMGFNTFMFECTFNALLALESLCKHYCKHNSGFT